MAMIPIERAAERIGVSVATIEDWARQGLLDIEPAPPAGRLAPQRVVDEEHLHEVAESLGWLKLSLEAWERIEEEE